MTLVDTTKKQEDEIKKIKKELEFEALKSLICLTSS